MLRVEVHFCCRSNCSISNFSWLCVYCLPFFVTVVYTPGYIQPFNSKTWSFEISFPFIWRSVVFFAGSSHSDKEAEAITPEKGGGTRTGSERKRKRKTDSNSDGKSVRVVADKKAPSLDYFTKHPPGASPIRHTASGAKSPSPAAQQPYPMVSIMAVSAESVNMFIYLLLKDSHLLAKISGISLFGILKDIPMCMKIHNMFLHIMLLWLGELSCSHSGKAFSKFGRSNAIWAKMCLLHHHSGSQQNRTGWRASAHFLPLIVSEWMKKLFCKFWALKYMKLPSNSSY